MSNERRMYPSDAWLLFGIAMIGWVANRWVERRFGVPRVWPLDQVEDMEERFR